MAADARGQKPRVLAIGIDAAEASFVKRLIAEGSLPVMGALAAEGEWRSVDAYGDLGAGTVWPTFITGRTPEFHGVSADMQWKPQRMEMAKPNRSSPMWAGNGARPRVGTLDVPYVMPTGSSGAFEVCAWGPQWFRESPVTAQPLAAATAVRALGSYPPIGEALGPPPAPTDDSALERLCARSVAGIRLRGELACKLVEETRPDLAIVVFPEIHNAGHALWHTVEPSHRLYAKLPPVRTPAKGGIYEQTRALDDAIGRLLEAAPDAAVVVFSLHGMAANGVKPSFLSPLLIERRWAAPLAPHVRNAGAFARNAVATTKGRAPQWVRRRYHTTMPREAVRRIATKTMTAGHEWAGTRAFALPTEQWGCIRVNLRGREREGIVSARDYQPIVDALASELAELKTTGGRPLVSRVMPGAPGGGPHPTLPDLVIHWTEDAYDRPYALADSTVTTPAVRPRQAGRHVSAGFCISRGLSLPQGHVQGDRLAAHLIEAAEG
jgi:predicted AlkP superfamily phosphohydrolase/phosphomutase